MMRYPSFGPNSLEFLRQPAWIAALTSVSFHTLLVVLPAAPRERLNPVKAPVNVIELNGLEAGRLPDLSPPTLTNSLPIDISALPLPPLPTDVTPAFVPPPAPELQAIAPEQQNYITFSGDRLPPQTLLEQPVRRSVPPEPDLVEVPPSSPPTGELPKVDPTELTLEQITERLAKDPRYQQQIAANEEWERRARQEAGLPVEEPPQPENTPNTPNPLSGVPDPTKSPNNNLQQLQQQQAQADSRNLTNGEQAANPPANSRPPEPNPQLAYSSEGTQDSDWVGNFNTWRTQAQQTSGNSSLEPERKAIALTASYPPEACAIDFKGEAYVGVLVSAEGKPIGEPQLLRKTGYQLLDQIALEQAKNHPFAPSDQIRAQPVTVSFTRTEQVCPNPSTTPERS